MLVWLYSVIFADAECFRWFIPVSRWYTEFDLHRVGITELEETQPPADTKALPHYHIQGQN